MADVTTELMFEVMKSVQARLAQVDGKIDELKQEMQASRTSQNGIRHEGRLDRIEKRLELSDAPKLT